MSNLQTLETELHEKRRLCGWYGMRGDDEMRKQLASECYDLWQRLSLLQDKAS
jgi:hypothetical protein